MAGALKGLNDPGLLPFLQPAYISLESPFTSLKKAEFRARKLYFQ